MAIRLLRIFSKKNRDAEAQELVSSICKSTPRQNQRITLWHSRHDNCNGLESCGNIKGVVVVGPTFSPCGTKIVIEVRAIAGKKPKSREYPILELNEGEWQKTIWRFKAHSYVGSMH